QSPASLLAPFARTLLPRLRPSDQALRYKSGQPAQCLQWRYRCDQFSFLLVSSQWLLVSGQWSLAKCRKITSAMALPLRCAASLRLAGPHALRPWSLTQFNAVIDRETWSRAFRQVEDLPRIGAAEPGNKHQ